jgi:hypothetical protein
MLEACDDETVSTVEEVIAAFSQPFIASVVHDLLRRGAAIVLDLDLTGQAVRGVPPARATRKRPSAG